MKKLSLLVSCFAVLLLLSNVSVAQEPAACPCPMASNWAASPWVVPIVHPGLSINPREARRATRLDGRIAIRQMRLEYRHTMPAMQGFPFMPPAGYAVAPEGTAGDGFPFGFSSNVAQTGRINNSMQRVSANNAPVINFMSVVRPGVHFVPAAPQ